MTCARVCADMVAVPVYPSVATEHWGLLTVRENVLLYDSDQVNDFDKQRTINVIAHELAHNVSHPRYYPFIY